MKTLFAVAATAALSNVAFGFGTAGAFVGDFSDSFETYLDYNSSQPTSLDILGGAGQLTGPSNSIAVISPTAGWGLGNNGSGYANSGVQAMGLINNTPGPVTLTFDTAQQRVGAYWQTVDEAFGGLFNLSFYDASNNLLGTDSFVHTDNAYQWHGWESNVGIKSIVMQGNLAPVMDDLQISASPVPEPGTMIALGLGLAAAARRRRA